jgi:dihydroneopterin aldolase
MGDVIRVRGLRVMGVHGVLAGERERAQPFEVDLDLHVDLRNAGASDRLEDTVDYGAVADAVARCVAEESHALLERLAERIAGVVLTHERVTSVTVTVKKLEPPLTGDVDHVAVTITRP